MINFNGDIKMKKLHTAATLSILLLSPLSAHAGEKFGALTYLQMLAL